MLGAIIGDMVGSTHEFKTAKQYKGLLFPGGSRMTDDTVLTLATAYAILHNVPYGDEYARFFSQYSFYQNEIYLGLEMGFGPMFVDWAMKPDDEREPYNSFGNGSGMRVSSIGWAFESLGEVLLEAERSAICTHNHPEGIKGAKAIAGAVFLARTGSSREEIAVFVENDIGYSLNFDLKELHRSYRFNPTCQGSVPQAIFCALNASSFEEVLRLCLYIGGDTDTIAAMAGGIAEPLFGIPEDIKAPAIKLLSEEKSELKEILDQFYEMYWHETTPVGRLKKKVKSNPMKVTLNVKEASVLDRFLAIFKKSIRG